MRGVLPLQWSDLQVHAAENLKTNGVDKTGDYLEWTAEIAPWNILPNVAGGALYVHRQNKIHSLVCLAGHPNLDLPFIYMLDILVHSQEQRQLRRQDVQSQVWCLVYKRGDLQEAARNLLLVCVFSASHGNRLRHLWTSVQRRVADLADSAHQPVDGWLDNQR